MPFGMLDRRIEGVQLNQGNILVTGGAGYIGSHVVLALDAAGFGVVIYDDLSTGTLRSMHERCAIVHGDIGNRKRVYDTLSIYNCIGVIHLAGAIIVPESVRRPLHYYDNNTARSHALIEACVAYGIGGFIFSSSAAVYGLPEKLPITEDSSTAPINAYGTSKLMSEQMLRDTAHAYDLPVTILRYFNVAGADPRLRAGQKPDTGTHLIKIACDAALGRRDHVEIFGTDYPTPDGSCIRDFIHVSDLAAAHIAALKHLLAGGELAVANCGYGRGFSVRQVIDTVGRVAGRPIKFIESPRRPGDPPEIVANNDKLCRELRWKPKFDRLEQIVGDNLRWMRHCGECGAETISRSG